MHILDGKHSVMAFLNRYLVFWELRTYPARPQLCSVEVPFGMYKYETYSPCDPNLRPASSILATGTALSQVSF